MPASPGRYAALLALVVGGAIAGGLLGGTWLWLHYVCKPLATLMVLAWVLRAAPPVSVRYRRAIALGVVFSLVGDVLLMLPQGLFLGGLVAFLLAHLCFIVALWPGGVLGANALAVSAYAALAAVNLGLLWPHVPGAMRVPVLAYVAVLVLMAALAAARAWALRGNAALSRPARLAAVGGALFVLSDSLLAWNHFRAGLPLALLWVLASYYASLWCIARSVARPAGQRA
ncbi:MAG: lysoplasmalogenase [Rhizobium sp.]|nr:lysoplasmalogenase [Rhizobium sp.]